MCRGTMESCVIGNCKSMFASEYTVVLCDHNNGCHNVDSLPNPIVISVNINAQYANFSMKSILLNQFINIVSINPGMYSSKVMPPISVIFLDIINIAFTSVHYETAPIIIYQQEASVRLCVIFYPKFHKGAAIWADMVNKILNDSVIAKL